MHIIKEFKDFINRGNVIDLAVAVIMGAAFTAITTSIVNDLITPIISCITGGIDFSQLSITLGIGEHPAILNYGKFIQSVINFLLISVVIFIMVKTMNKVLRKKPVEEPQTQTCPYCATQIPAAATRCPHCTSQLDTQTKD
jgi:large conductance mechanosensitive channel